MASCNCGGKRVPIKKATAKKVAAKKVTAKKANPGKARTDAQKVAAGAKRMQSEAKKWAAKAQGKGGGGTPCKC